MASAVAVAIDYKQVTTIAIHYRNIITTKIDHTSDCIIVSFVDHMSSTTISYGCPTGMGWSVHQCY